MPDVARVLPIARELQFEGVQRYGFHGLSCESIVRQLANDLPHRLVIAHLGNGASVTAVHAGKSIDTSMGLTPTGGVIMGTRSGDLDPGVLVYLMRRKGCDGASSSVGGPPPASLKREFQGSTVTCGGCTKRRRQMRMLELRGTMLCYSVRKQVATTMIAALNGADLVVFTGGIGENDVEVRAAICGGLPWLGICPTKPEPVRE